MNITAERIKAIRRKKGYTLDDLSKKTKISKTTLQRYETGSSTIKSNRLITIAEALDVSPAFLMGWEEEATDFDFINAIFKKLDYELYYDSSYNDYFFIKNNQLNGYVISPSELNQIKKDILNYTNFKLTAIQNELNKKSKEFTQRSNSHSNKE